MHQHYNVIIVGQGIAGTLLSYECYIKGISFIVIDEPNLQSSSFVSGAVLNAHNRNKDTTLALQFFEKARDTYLKMDEILGISSLHDCDIAWFDEALVQKTFVSEEERLSHFFNFDTLHITSQAAYVDSTLLLKTWRHWLQAKGCLYEDLMDENQLNIMADKVVYKDISAEKIILCNGIAAKNSALFPHLPFTANRGDVLALSIPGLSQNYVYQQQLRLIPRGGNMFWCGSNYNWNYADLNPDVNFLKHSTQILDQWLKTAHKVTAHICAERPTTAGQLPIIGWHDIYKNVGIINGLGTKGFTAGPLWIANFVKTFSE